MPRSALVAACFFLSGLGSLILEVVWTRELRLVFGSTTLAASSTLVAYMLGLGLGGLVGGSLASRLRSGVRAYALIEIAIGLYALAVPWMLALLPGLNRSWLYGMAFWEAAIWRFVVVLLLLLVPTLLMGATLPILVAALARRGARVGESTGLLYGLNTLGAVVGVFGTTYVFFPTLGLSGSNALGACVDVAVGVLALVSLRGVWALPARAAEPEPTAPAEPRGAVRVSPWVLLLAYALVGFSALAYEIAWMRGLAIVVGSSIYGFASMLGTFLAGIALGSLLARRLIESLREPVVAFAWGIALLGALALGTSILIPHLPALFVAAVSFAGISAGSVALSQLSLCIGALLPPTLVLGALFPLVCRALAAQGGEAGWSVGRVYFANTIGSATGAFVAGFWLLPTWGLRNTLAGLSALDLAVAALLLLVATRRLGTATRASGLVPLAAAAALALVPIPFDHHALTRGFFKSPHLGMEFGLPLAPIDGVPASRVDYYRDGINGTVSVDRELGSKLTMRVNGKPDASNDADMPTQVLLGELPLLFGPVPRRVLVIGYASGVTVGSVARHAEVSEIDSVEIEPATIAASRLFDRESGSPLEDPRVRVLFADGRNYLAATRDPYDLIISEPSNPWMSGVANLFTREFFAAAYRALTPTGRLMQWIHLYALEPEALQSILRAMNEVFPYVYGFAYAEGDADLFLLGTKTPLSRADLPEWDELAPAVRSDLERIGTFSTADLWSLLRLLPEDVAALARRAPAPNTDDNLKIELGSPWMLYRETTAPNWETFARNPRGIVSLLERLEIPVAEHRGPLALSYVSARGALDVATRLAEEADQNGEGDGYLVAAALLQALRAGAPGLGPEQQIAHLDRALQLSPASAELLLLRGETLAELGRPNRALRDARAVLDLRPGDVRARHLEARMLAERGLLEDALAAAGSLLATEYPQYDPSIHELVARLQIRTGRLTEARATLEAYLHGENSGWHEGWSLLAEVCARLGDPGAAARYRANAENTLRNFAVIVHRSARLALWSGDRARATALLEMVREAEPENQLVLADLARLQADPVELGQEVDPATAPARDD